MSKITIGDYVYNDYRHENGTVIGDRGGYVGRWVLKLDNGDTVYCSSRDISVIKSAAISLAKSRITTDEKLELLLEYLGLRIEDDPKVTKIKVEE